MLRSDFLHPKIPSLRRLSLRRLPRSGMLYRFVLVINLKLLTRPTPCLGKLCRCSGIMLTAYGDSVKAIIWLHNLTISHLEIDYYHSSDTLFSFFLILWLSNSVAFVVTQLVLQPRRPTEAEQVFSFSIVTILVSMSAGFWLVCIFTSDITPSFKIIRMKGYCTSMCLILLW